MTFFPMLIGAPTTPNRESQQDESEGNPECKSDESSLCFFDRYFQGFQTVNGYFSKKSIGPGDDVLWRTLDVL